MAGFSPSIILIHMVERGIVISSKVSCPLEHDTVAAQKCCDAQNLGSLTNPYPKENIHTDWLIVDVGAGRVNYHALKLRANNLIIISIK